MELQPHEGSSGTHLHRRSTVVSASFNPTRVRLEPARPGVHPGGVDCFNPTRVRLERRVSTARGRLSARFNPTRVRLEPRVQRLPHSVHRLQPHEGSSGTLSESLMAVSRTTASTPRGFVWNKAIPCAIDEDRGASTPRGFVWNAATGDLRADKGDEASTPRGFVWNDCISRILSACSPLQPHEGSSGTGVRDDRRDDTARFNPTRVRLEPAIDDDGTEDIPLQPHEGSSGTDAAAGRVRREPRFNPTRVRLELVCYVFQPVNICPASTPRGFVWNSRRTREAARRLTASTPRGFVWNSL